MILLFCLLPFLALSPARADQSAPKVIIQQTDRDYPAEKLARPGVEVRKLNVPKRCQLGRVPTPKQRNSWISQAGLEDTVKNWDEFAKDELVIRADIMVASTFLAAYPGIDPKTLSKLQRIVKNK